MTPTQELRLTSALVSLFEVTQERFKEVTNKTGLSFDDKDVVMGIVSTDVLETTFKALPELRGNTKKVCSLAYLVAVLAYSKAFAQTDDEPDGSLEIPGA